MPIIVPAAGPTPSPVLIVGEAPGRHEAAHKPLPEPFVGPSGQIQEWHFNRHNLSQCNFRRTNIVPVYIEGNPDPSPSLVDEWTPHLLSEIRRCNPALIVAVGRFAMRWFLGESADLDITHGLPHHAGAFDPTRRNRAPSTCCIIPIIHPAAGFPDRDPKGEARVLISWDYKQVAETYKLIQQGQSHKIDYRVDKYAGKELYEDVTGRQMRDLINYYRFSSFETGLYFIGYDTEGTPDNRWSAQASFAPGQGAVLRCVQPDFSDGMAALQECADAGIVFVTHQASTPTAAMYDNLMSRLMGLNLTRARIWDTMYALYLMRTEARALKTAMRRWCGMDAEDYPAKLSALARDKQIQYLHQVLEMSPWPKPQSRTVYENDGRIRQYTPQRIEQTAESILLDALTGKVTKDGPTDPLERWKKIDKAARHPVELRLGKMPHATLDDVPFADAIRYSAADPDGTRRLYFALRKQLQSLDLIRTQDEGMAVLPIFEEMQHNGMPCSRSSLVSLSSDMLQRMQTVQRRISSLYYGSKPFNPNSGPQVASLLLRRGLDHLALKKTKKTKKISTAEDSIGHLQFSEPAIADVFEWREYQHIRSSFCESLLEYFPDDDSIAITFIRCVLKPTGTVTRRLAAEEPNLLNIPSRSEIGLKVRECFFFAPTDNEMFTSCDLSQIEARFMADVSADDLMCRLFLEGRDVHKETAARIFGWSTMPEDLTEEQKRQRYCAKTINFGMIYGMLAHALMIQLNKIGIMWKEDECERALAEWFKIYRGVKQFVAAVSSDTKRLGYVRDISGMYRYLPMIHSRDRKEVAQAERHAVSHIVQGGAQTMIQRSMAWLGPLLHEMADAGIMIKWRMQVHDELIVSHEATDEIAEKVRQMIIHALVKKCGVKLRVPVLAEGKSHKSWGKLK